MGWTIPFKTKGSLFFTLTTSYLNLDQTLGKISAISVKNGQEINENDVIATYQNTTIEDQAEEQTQSLEKLNLVVFVLHFQDLFEHL